MTLSNRSTAAPLALVTGATSGIGTETAKGLARKGFDLIIPARDLNKAHALQQAITQLAPPCKVTVLPCQLDSLASIAAFTQEVAGITTRLHVLVLNAGTWEEKRTVTQDGFETTMGVNHLAPFYLTWLLRPLIKSSGTRVVTVASGLHLRGKIDLEDLMMENRAFNGFQQYCNSKLANVLFTFQLARLLRGHGASANCLHPGVVSTNLGRNMGAMGKWFFKLAGLTPEKGARTSLYLATSPEVEGVTGKYFDKCAIAPEAASARNLKLANDLWQKSMALTGLTGATF